MHWLVRKPQGILALESAPQNQPKLDIANDNSETCQQYKPLLYSSLVALRTDRPTVLSFLRELLVNIKMRIPGSGG